MFGFGNDDKKDSFWNFGNSGSTDNGWGFGGCKNDKEIEDIWGIADREGRNFWDVLTDFFFR